MSRNEAFCHLKASLHDALTEWAEANAETDAWTSMGSYLGDDVYLLMAEAAVTVLKAQADVNRYFEEAGLLK